MGGRLKKIGKGGKRPGDHGIHRTGGRRDKKREFGMGEKKNNITGDRGERYCGNILHSWGKPQELSPITRFVGTSILGGEG